MANWKCPNCGHVLTCNDNIPAHTPQGPVYQQVSGECGSCGLAISDEWSAAEEADSDETTTDVLEQDCWQVFRGCEWRHVASGSTGDLLETLAGEPDGSYVICDSDSEGCESGDRYTVEDGVIESG